MQLIQWVIDMKLMIQWAITSSALILIVLAARYLFRNKLSARLRYALWGVVLLRLLVPFQVQLPAAGDALPVLASNLAQDVTPRLDDTMLYAIPTERSPRDQVLPVEPPQYTRTLHGEADWEYYSGGVVYDGKSITHYFFMMTALEVLIVIWVAGTALTALVVLASNLRFYSGLRKRRETLEGTEAPIPVYTAAHLSSPCLFGVFKPAVYVTPGAAEHPDALRHVLAHELTHYAHRDHIWSLLRCLSLALHWYNPLVWLAVWLSKGDGELACDEGAVARLGEGERVPYGRTLVDMVAQRSPRPADLLSCSTAMTGGRKSIQQRVAQLVKKPETVRTALFAAVSVLILAAVFVFAERGPAERENGILLDYLERTTAIRYCPPAYSSTFYPYPISGEDLLPQAKEALSGFRLLDSEDPQPDLSTKELLHESRVILTFEGEDKEYSLLWQNDHTYLFPGNLWRQSIDLQEEEGETAQLEGVSGTCISRQGDDVISVLEGLARLSTRKDEAGSPELDRFLTDLASVQSIFVGQPLHYSTLAPGRIDTPENLTQAKELLSQAIPVAEVEDGVWAPLSLSSDSQDQKTVSREELKHQFLLEGCPVSLFPTKERDLEAARRYWLVPWEGFCLLVQPDDPVTLVACFPSDLYDQLAELASFSVIIGTATLPDPSPLDQFLRDVGSATSIWLHSPSSSSAVYSEPITDPDLLAQAKEKLCLFVEPEENDTLPSPKKLWEASRIVLSDGRNEVTYTLMYWNEWAWVIPGDALSEYLSLEEGEEWGYGPIFRAQVRSSMIPSSIASLARMQEMVLQAPGLPIPMSRTELERYSLDFVKALGHQLQGLPNPTEEFFFLSGQRDRAAGSVQLMYDGDKEHWGRWVLELREGDWTVLADQPSVVLLDARYREIADDFADYEVMPTDRFVACLRPEDVVSVTAGSSGQEITLDLPALKGQLTQAMYHLFSNEYDQEKHGQYTITIQVRGSGMEEYMGREIAEDADRLTLSVGSEKDVVCLRHRNFAVIPEPVDIFARSPELYRAIRNIYD